MEKTSQAPQYELVDCTQEELSAFYKDLNGILELHSVYIEPVPAFSRKSMFDPFTPSANLLIQKKVKKNVVPSENSGEVVPEK